MHRRSFIGGAAASLAGMAGVRGALAAPAAKFKPYRHFVFVVLPGGPSQFETWDPKPGHVNGGPTKAIDTKVKGMRWAENMAPLVEYSDNIAVVRTTSGIGAHDLAYKYTMTGGFTPNPRVDHPSLSSTIGWGLYDPERDLPPVVSSYSGFYGAQGGGFLGNTFDQYPMGSKLEVDEQWRGRMERANQLREEYYALSPLRLHRDFQEEVKHQSRASRLTLGISHRAFDVSQESQKTREFYGPGFGESCLRARRLIMAGVTSIEITCAFWDTHQDNFGASARSAAVLTRGLGCLISELKELDLFEQTLILVGGEMGRSPQIEKQTEGRGHFPQNSCFALIGGGIKGQSIGESSQDGLSLAQPITMGQLSYSVLELMGMRPLGFFEDPVSGRPQRYCAGDTGLPAALV
ncbi:MAG: hypothetical protein RL095_2437 [Verrucomicrobiota bacterium]|jgi:hypothetical protein